VSLIDFAGRRIRKLRVSLVDACNFRCFYCMPDRPQFLPRSELLAANEIVATCGELNRLGVTEIRLTGGEPTIRPDFDDIVARLSALPLTKLGLTTNGFLLGRRLDLLRDSACRHINVSLDSLRPDRFCAITRTPHFDVVRGNVVAAKRRGFEVKVNVVVCRGRNDDELLDFMDFSAEHGIPVRFLELMRIGPRHAEFGELFVSADEMIERIGRHHTLTSRTVPADSTAFAYTTDQGAEIGFIASESRPFCGTCSRLRLAANGHLRACLMSERGVNIRGMAGAALWRAVHEVMAMKPLGRLPHVEQAMYQIGG
jgi:GTP 3',8-cyclase